MNTYIIEVGNSINEQYAVAVFHFRTFSIQLVRVLVPLHNKNNFNIFCDEDMNINIDYFDSVLYYRGLIFTILY